MLLKEGLVYMRIKSLTVLATKMKRNDKCHFSPSDCKNNKKTCSVRELESQTFLHGPSKNIKGPSLSERHFYSLYIKASWKMLVWEKRQKRKEERDRTPIWPTGAGGGPRPEPGARSAVSISCPWQEANRLNQHLHSSQLRPQWDPEEHEPGIWPRYSDVERGTLNC